MRVRITRTGIVLTAGVTVFAALAGVVNTIPASAAQPSSATSRTCAAFTTWNAHRTASHLDALMTVGESASWRYVGEDASGLYADVRSSAAAKYVAKDIRYFKSDCAS